MLSKKPKFIPGKRSLLSFMNLLGMRTLILLLFCFPFLSSAQDQSFNMMLLGNVDPPDMPTRFGAEYSDCWGFTHASGTEIAIIAGTEDILFVDVTSPGNTYIIHTHHVQNMPSGSTNQSHWSDFATYENYLFAVSDEGSAGLLIFDLSAVPFEVSLALQTTAFFERSHTVTVDEENGRLYANGSNTVPNGLCILELEPNPANPFLGANVPLNNVGGGYVHDSYVKDNICYASHGNLSKIQMYDFTQLPNFSVVGIVEDYPESGYNHSSWLNEAGTHIAMCDENHGSDVKLVDVTDPLNISSDDINTFFSELEGPDAPGSSIAHNPYILGDLCYVAYYHDGVQVFNISNPENIEMIAYYDTYPENSGYPGYDGCWAAYPFLPSGIILASDMNNGLFIMEIEELNLAIDFLGFKAYIKDSKVTLDWSVENVSFGNKFEIMKSIDGGVHFESAGFVDYDASESFYRFQDPAVSASTKYAYRIDFIQLDGSRITSPMRFVLTGQGQLSLQVMNPFTGNLSLDVLQETGPMELVLYNLEGKIVWQQELETTAAHMEFDTGHLPAGQYHLSARWEGGSQNVIVQKIR